MATKLLSRVFKLKSIGKAGLKITAGCSNETKGSGDDRLRTDDLLLNDVGIEGGKIIGTDETKLLRLGETPIVGISTPNSANETVKGLSGSEQGQEDKGIETEDKKIVYENLLTKTKVQNDEHEVTASTFSNEEKKTKTQENIESTVYKANLEDFSSKKSEFDGNSETVEQPKPFGFAESTNNPVEADKSKTGSSDLSNKIDKVDKDDKVSVAEPIKSGLSSQIASTPKPPKSLENLYDNDAISSFSSEEDHIDYKDIRAKQSSKKPITDFNPSFVDPTPDRRLNIGRSDQEVKKDSSDSKSYFFEKTDAEERLTHEPETGPPKKASGIYKSNDNIKRICSGGTMPDLVSSQNEYSNPNYISTIQNIISARSGDKQGNMFNFGKFSESNVRSRPFPVDAMDPRAIPSYTPALSEKPFLPKDFFKFAEPSTISSYDLVPGPTLLRTVGNVWKYVPLLGTQFVATFIYSLQNLITSYDRKVKYPHVYPYYYLLNKYGPLVRLHGPIGGDILIMAVNGHSFPLIHVKTRGSKRQSLFDSLNIYRRDATPLTYMLSIPKVSNVPDHPSLKIDQYYSTIEKITDDFVKRKKFVRNYAESKKDDLYGNELIKWAMQCTMEVYFKSKINYFDKSEGEASKVIENFVKVTQNLRLCETGIQLWRLFSTFAWLDLTEHCKHLDRFIAYEMNQCVNTTSKTEEPSSVVELLLGTEELATNDFLTPLLDLLIINVNMAATMAGFLLYNLGKTPQAQRTLFREISSVLPKGGGNISQADLAKLKYLNACIIETLRMTPPFPMLSRQLEEDTKIHRFQIPKNTYIQMVNVLPCARGDVCYEDIGRFQAERWTDKATSLGGDPLIGLPQWQSFPKFNRDLIVTQVALLVAKVVREYRIEYPAVDVYSDGMVLQSSTIPFNFIFIERVL